MGRFCGRVLMVALALGAVVATAEAQPATITGRVTNTLGQPLAEVDVRLRDPGGIILMAAFSNADGQYVITGVAPGTYYLNTHNGVGYSDETRDGTQCTGSCDLIAPIVIAPGQMVQQDFTLEQGVVLSGRVLLAATRQPPTNFVSLTLYSAARRVVAFTSTRSDGTYTFRDRSLGGGLAGGTYYIVVSHPPDGFSRRAYSGVSCATVAACLASATPIRVAPGEVVPSGLDLLLEPMGTGTISGRVVDIAGVPVPMASVTVSSATLNSPAWNMTGAAGRFTIGGLPAGTYTLLATAAGKVPHVFDGIDAPACGQSFSAACQAARASGTPVTVGQGRTVDGINIVMRLGGAIAGRLTRAGQAVSGAVRIYDPAGTEAGVATTDLAGRYTVITLSAGRYFAVATASGAASTLYPSRPCPGTSYARIGCSVGSGTPVVVAEGATTTGIDFDLPAMATRIGGKVTSRSVGAPVGATVALYLADRAAGETRAASDGTYAFTDLEPGVYRVRASAAGFAAGWHHAACVFCGDRGTGVALAAGATADNIDVQLDAEAKITGRVTFSAATRSPDGRFIEALRADGSQAAFVFPNFGLSPTADYTIAGLPAGSYFVRASTILAPLGGFIPNGAEYASQLYNNVACDGATCPLTGATAVTVTAGATASGIDFVLDPGGFIEGTVFAGGAPSPDATVDLFAADGRPAGQRNGVDSMSLGRGRYLFSGLSPGRYFVRARAPGYAATLYGDLACGGCAPQSGRGITVAAGERRSNIDVSLAPAGSIGGTVRDAAGALLSGITLTAYTEGGAVAATTVSTGLGGYRLEELTAGPYFIATTNPFGYADQVFDNVSCGSCDPARGRAVVVQGGATAGGIDFTLSGGMVVSGTVTGPGGAGVARVPVTLVSGSGTPVARVQSDDLGVFSASVPSGVAYGKAGPAPGAGARLYRDLPCAGGTCDPTTGTVITGSAGDRVTGIDFSLGACGPTLMLPSTLPSGTIGVLYAASLSTSGAGSFSFALQSGTLPPGVSLEAGGSITGTPSAAGRYTFTASAADAGGCGSSKSFTLDVAGCAVTLTRPSDGVFFAFAGTAVLRQDYSASCAVTPFISAPWILPFPSGAGAVEFILIQNTGPRRTGTVRLGTRTLTIHQAAGVSTPPFGSFDTPADGAIVSGSVAFTGWALDDHHVGHVSLYRAPVAGEPPGDIFIGTTTFVPGARPDVERLYPELPDARRAGWGYLLLTNMLPNQGNGTFTITAIMEDHDGHRLRLGSRTIVANNATATQPFGAIDTPPQGGTISGASYVNFGWALTPRPKTIPTNGSTIRVFIDGAAVGTVSYNHFRQDIASLFPGLSNTSGAVGFRMIDTTTLADGLHTIAWVVSDDSGAAEGIGSRYFTVANGSAQFTSGVLTPPRLLAAPASAVVRQVFARELEPISIDLAPDEPVACRSVFSGVERVGAEQRALPVGSTLDRDSGVFRWQPGPGFIGTYHLSFDVGQCDGGVKRIDVDVTISRDD